MIYVNGTEMKTVGDLYINGATPNAVYCNGTLVWAKLVTKTFWGYYGTTLKLTYYLQPGSAAQTTSKNFTSSSSMTVSAGTSQAVTVTTTVTGAFVPSVGSVSPSNWLSNQTAWSKMTNQSNPTYTEVMSGDELTYKPSYTAVRAKLKLSYSSPILECRLFTSVVNTNSYLDLGTSSSSSWYYITSSSKSFYPVIRSSAANIKQYYAKVTSASGGYNYYWLYGNVSSDNINNGSVSISSAPSHVSKTDYSLTVFTIQAQTMDYLTLEHVRGTTYRITNNLMMDVTVEYNAKKCDWNDGINWSGLSDVKSVSIAAGGSTTVTISSNWFADAETCSIKAPNGYRYISCLGSDGYLSTNVITY